ncbi:MAG: phosphoribosylamine--glycine ligase [Synechococcaceae cyanobacterium RL_1_2]|nr:phosphoribosylamine--glycine ligase [Synechococcaceae cyanobacterium RL_1_2]
MKILVVGSGGREHALAWKLKQSSTVDTVYSLPGNGGTKLNLAIDPQDFSAILQTVQEQEIDLVVIGPEAPLSEGLTDYLQQHQIKVFGPTKAGAQLEASKSWAKELMNSAGIPTAFSETFSDLSSALVYLAQQQAPIVIKADGLAAGKGVIVAQTMEEAQTGLERLFAEGYGHVMVEEFLAGEEVSVLALTDGKTITPLIPAQDHKRIGEGDTGENTGGMGVYAPAPIATPALMKEVTETILKPTLQALQQRGIDYRGVIYAGLMVGSDGKPKVLEFNCRFGDPETQAILPLLKTPLDQVLMACATQTLGEHLPLAWHKGHAVCVIAAAGGYPGSYAKGNVIQGLSSVVNVGAIPFHAGTQEDDQGQILTNGGRVLGITAVGATFQEARNTAYRAMEYVKFDDIYFRKDIGWRVLARES